MKTYKVVRTETYYIKANTPNEAQEIVSNLDSGSALLVDYATTEAGQK